MLYSKFTGEHPYRSMTSIKIQSNFIEITLQHGCSPVNSLHIFRAPFPKNTSGGLLLNLQKPNSVTDFFHENALRIFCGRKKTYSQNNSKIVQYFCFLVNLTHKTSTMIKTKKVISECFHQKWQRFHVLLKIINGSR